MRRTGGTVVAVGFLTAMVSAMQAQTPAMPRVEFDEAIAQALARNPTVGQAATGIARAEALLQQARAGVRPTAGAQFTNVTLDSARGFNGGVTQPQNQTTIGVDLSYPILAFSRWAALGQAKDQIDIARASTADVRRAIAVSTAQAYLAVVAAHRQVDVDERALASARAHLDYAQKRLDAGAGSQVNQLRAAGEEASDESRLETTRLALRRSQEALGALLVVDGPVDTGREPTFDAPAGAAGENVSARTDVKLQVSNQVAAERVLKDSNKDWLPTGTVSFDPQIIVPKSLFQPSKTWRLTVSVTQPLFEGGLKKAVVRQREVAVEAAKLAVAVVENQARADVRIARASVESYDKVAASARLAAQRSEDVLRITTTAFEVGATTNLEVIDAQRSARDAATVVTLAEDALRRARLDLLVALGLFPKI